MKKYNETIESIIYSLVALILIAFFAFCVISCHHVEEIFNAIVERGFFT